MSTSPNVENGMTCTECGAIIYQEHLDRGLAGYRDGKLLCPHCLDEKKKNFVADLSDDERLSLVDETEVTDRSDQASIYSPTGAEGGGPAPQEFKRPLNQTGQGASRIRVFHAKLSDGAVRHLEEMVNTWLDDHPEVDVKFSTTTVGSWESKHSESHIILTLFY